MSEPTSHPEAERIEDEAAVWAARLRGGALTDADRALLQAWLERDPEHRWVLSRYRELSAELDGHFDGGAEPFVQQATRRRHRRIVAGVLAAAAALAVLFIVLGARPQEFATRLAERHIATLADGSRIELNAQTRLTVKLTRHERHVRLLQGEALFTVAKDPLRPFVVDTPAGAVRVTGTVFNVRTSPAAPGHGEGVRAEVTVLEGHVRVRPTTAGAEDDTALVPGRQALLDAQSVSVRTLPLETAQDAVAWRHGEVVFNDTPLEDAMERFAAYHARRIVLAREVADLRLGGRFSLDDLEGALELIERVLPVRMERGADALVKIVPASAR